jgi:hypothetical protein
MKRAHLAGAAVAALAACLLVPFAGSAAGPPDAVCPQDTMTFTGTAQNLTVPAGGSCAVTDATITHDLILLDGAGADVTGTSVGHDVVFGEDAGAGIVDSTVGHDVVAGGTDSGADVIRTTVVHDLVARGDESGFDVSESTVGHDMLLLGPGGGAHMGLTTIGHDFFASKPNSVQTSRMRRDAPEGTVKVGHDFTIEGAPDFPFVFDGLCDLQVTRDLRVTDRTVNLGIGLGGQCAGNGVPADTIGRDLVVTGNHAASGVFGPSSINVGADQVGRDLVFSNNTAVPGGSLIVSGNTVGRDATCAANSPAVTVNTPNTAGRSNTCG